MVKLAFSHLSLEYTDVTLTGQHDADDIFKSCVKVTLRRFPIMRFFDGGIPTDGLPSDTI